MRHIKRVSVNELKTNYDLIVGWGNSPLELTKRVTASDIHIDYIINGEGKDVGKTLCGAEIVNPEYFINYKGNILFIIFSNLESLLLNQISLLYPMADTIVSRLVDMPGSYREHSYSRDLEDIILMDLIKKLEFPMDFLYLDIGVCHPVVRNNTYMFYENGYTNGVLVEPNPEMLDLAIDYRPLNKRINAGAGIMQGILPYIRQKNGGQAGLNHFKKEGEVIDIDRCIVDDLPVYEINNILDNMLQGTPWVLDLDCEQMDLEIISNIDFTKHPIKIICVERDRKRQMYDLLASKSYIHYADTLENLIFVNADAFGLLFQNNRTVR